MCDSFEGFGGFGINFTLNTTSEKFNVDHRWDYHIYNAIVIQSSLWGQKVLQGESHIYMMYLNAQVCICNSVSTRRCVKSQTTGQLPIGWNWSLMNSIFHLLKFNALILIEAVN